MERNEIRIGRISSVNRNDGMCKVVYKDKDDAVTMELPLFSLWGEWKPPEVDALVAVIHLSNGSAAGIILGEFWSEEHPPKEPEADYRKDMAADAYVMHKDGTLTIKAKKVIIETDGGEVDMDDVADLVADAADPDPDPEQDA